MPLPALPFRYRDSITGKWVRARYKAEPHVIAERFAEWEITGPAEQRTVRRFGTARRDRRPESAMTGWRPLAPRGG
jgi:hypothetical protein